MTERIRTPFLIASFVAFAMLMVSAAGDALAQDQPSTPPSEFTEEQVEAFADAALEVRTVQEEFQGELQGMDSPEEIEQLQQQAEQQATQAIEQSGLTVEEYNAILEAANADPQLYAMIVDLMEQRAQ